jgi:hypothetical protein
MRTLRRAEAADVIRNARRIAVGRVGTERWREYESSYRDLLRGGPVRDVLPHSLDHWVCLPASARSTRSHTRSALSNWLMRAGERGDGPFESVLEASDRVDTVEGIRRYPALDSLRVPSANARPRSGRDGRVHRYGAVSDVCWPAVDCTRARRVQCCRRRRRRVQGAARPFVRRPYSAVAPR